MRALPFLVALLAIPLAGASWPSFHNDERNTGFQSGSAFQAYKDVWWNLKVDPATQIEASPIVSGNLVVMGGWDKELRVLDVESGNLVWKATVAGQIVGTPAIAGSRLFAVDTTGSLKAYDLQKGTVLGTAAVGPTKAGITVHEGKLFVGNEMGEMNAFDTDTLTLLWKFPISSLSPGSTTTTTGSPPVSTTTCQAKFVAASSQIRSTPVVYGGKVIFASLNHWVFAVNEQGETGQTTDPQWIFETNDAVFGSPSIDSVNNRVIVGSFDEKVYSMPVSPAGQGPIAITAGGTSTLCTAFKNTATWTYTVPADFGQSKVQSTAAVDGTNAYFGANNGRVYAVKLSDGTKVWDFVTGGAVTSSPAVANSIVVVGSDDGKVYWLNSGDGTKIKDFIADSSVKASPAIDGNKTFAASFEGNLYMFGPTIPKRPDLQVTSASYLDGVVTILVANVGTGDAAASSLRLTIDGALVGDLPVGAITAGQTATITKETKLAAGVHSVLAQADQGAAVKESVENNNDLPTSITVEKAKKKDNGIPAPAPALVMLGLALLVAARRRKA